MSLKTLPLVLSTEYRANFLGIFIDVAWQLGGSAVTTDQPPSHQATKPYNLDWPDIYLDLTCSLNFIFKRFILHLSHTQMFYIFLIH